MSMVSTFVQSEEGHWYKNPVVKTDDWFICWDDDEPIELVVKRDTTTIWAVLGFLAGAGWDLKKIGKAQYSKRCFDGEGFHDAISVFLRQLNNGPPDKLLTHEKMLSKKPNGDGVYYISSPNGN